jgi:DNA polymerase-3 subunit delta
MPTFYVIHGEDSLAIDETIRRFRADMGTSTEAEMNISDVDGTTTPVSQVLNLVSSYPFLSDRRMVIVRGMLSYLTRKGASKANKEDLARLGDELPNLPPYARLIFLEMEVLPDKHPILALATQHQEGYVRSLSAPKNISSWIIKRAQDVYFVSIEQKAANALATITGDDLRRADNELSKLADYIGAGRAINEDDVSALTPYIPEANIFKMVDAIAIGDGNTALTLMHTLLRDKKQDALGLINMVIRQFRLLIQARAHLDSGGSGGELARVLKASPYVAQNIQKQVRNFQMPDLSRIYHNLHEMDIRIKTGRIQPDLALDLFIVNLAR